MEPPFSGPRKVLSVTGVVGIGRRHYTKAGAPSAPSAGHLNVAPGRVLDWPVLGIADLRRLQPSTLNRLDPLLPVRPPRARMLLGDLQPVFVGVADRLRSGPELVLVACRRIDDTGDVARSGKHELNIAAEERRAVEHRARRRDVVLARGKVVDRDGDL